VQGAARNEPPFFFSCRRLRSGGLQTGASLRGKPLSHRGCARLLPPFFHERFAAEDRVEFGKPLPSVVNGWLPLAVIPNPGRLSLANVGEGSASLLSLFASSPNVAAADHRGRL
jgi:hypothetical protein